MLGRYIGIDHRGTFYSGNSVGFHPRHLGNRCRHRKAIVCQCRWFDRYRESPLPGKSTWRCAVFVCNSVGRTTKEIKCIIIRFKAEQWAELINCLRIHRRRLDSLGRRHTSTFAWYTCHRHIWNHPPCIAVSDSLIHHFHLRSLKWMAEKKRSRSAHRNKSMIIIQNVFIQKLLFIWK